MERVGSASDRMVENSSEKKKKKKKNPVSASTASNKRGGPCPSRAFLEIKQWSPPKGTNEHTRQESPRTKKKKKIFERRTRHTPRHGTVPNNRHERHQILRSPVTIRPPRPARKTAKATKHRKLRTKKNLMPTCSAIPVATVGQAPQQVVQTDKPIQAPGTGLAHVPPRAK